MSQTSSPKQKKLTAEEKISLDLRRLKVPKAVAESLSTHDQILQTLAWTSKRLLQGKLPPSHATALSQLCNTALKALDSKKSASAGDLLLMKFGLKKTRTSVERTVEIRAAKKELDQALSGISNAVRLDPTPSGSSPSPSGRPGLHADPEPIILTDDEDSQDAQNESDAD